MRPFFVASISRAKVAMKLMRAQAGNRHLCQAITQSSNPIPETRTTWPEDLSADRRPVEEANGLPNAHYADPAMFQKESRTLLMAQRAQPMPRGPF